MLIFLRFVHMLGVVLWIGGGIAAMIAAMGARKEDPLVRAGAFRLIGRIHAVVIAPGALLTVIAGIVLVTMLPGMGASIPGVAAMEGIGLIAALVALFAGLPTSQKLTGLAMSGDAQGNLPPAFEKMRKRLAWIQSIGGTLALIALYFGVVR